jgi:hypothetical protein
MSTDLDDAALTKLEALAKAATPGPRVVLRDTGNSLALAVPRDHGLYGTFWITDRDVAFYNSLSPETILALIAALRKARHGP